MKRWTFAAGVWADRTGQTAKAGRRIKAVKVVTIRRIQVNSW
jgi:hypothetical protein